LAPPKILFAEAHADTSELYAVWFTQHDFVVSVCAVGVGDVEQRRAADMPDVVVAELMIPGGGPHLIERLRTLARTADAGDRGAYDANRAVAPAAGARGGSRRVCVEAVRRDAAGQRHRGREPRAPTAEAGRRRGP
jgi:hypothetical protein